jgi:tetratricopeptide (TPR) repeat protein
VCAGDWNLEAAAAICAAQGIGDEDVVALVASLVDKSMVMAPTRDGPGRYRLLETLRQYGAERLDARGETGGAGRAHAEHFLALAETAAVGLRGPDERTWVLRLRLDLANLRAAHAWCCRHGEVDFALRLSAALHRFAFWQANDEIFTWAAAATELDGAGGHPLLSTVLGSAGMGAYRRGELDKAIVLAERGLAAATDTDDPARAQPFEVLGEVWSHHGRLDEAFAAYQEAARLGRATDEQHTVVFNLAGQAVVRAYPGDVQTGLSLADEVHRMARESRNPTALAWSHYLGGEILLDEEPARALALLEESIKLATSVDNVFVTGLALLSATSLRGRHGEPERALRAYRQAIEHWRRHGNWTQQWITLRNLIELLCRVDAHQPAAALYGATTASITAPPTYGPESQRLDKAVAFLETAMGQTAFEAATRRGTTLTDNEVLILAVTTIDRVLAQMTACADGWLRSGRRYSGRPVVAKHSADAG